MKPPRTPLLVNVAPEARVTPVELFFDLVFVFALTQVTALMAGELTATGITRGLLLVGLLWWSWTGYAWLYNLVVADEGAVRATLFAAMTAMFLLALTIPEAFDDRPGGIDGPLVIAICYLAFRSLHLALFWIIAREDPGLRRQLIRFTPSVVGGTTLLLAASQFTGAVQTGLWALALLADYGGTFLGGASGWRLRSTGHFAERHGLIILVALGESVVAIGVGVAALPVSWPVLVASVLGLAVAAALWWAYFDVTALMGERALAAEPEQTRPRLARDAYSFLHLPMLAGVVLVALGLKKVLEYVADAGHYDLAQPLPGVALAALYGGVVLYLFAHVGFKLRILRSLTVSRVVAGVLLGVAAPFAGLLPALGALAVLAGALLAAIGYETVRFAEVRDSVRHAPSEAPPDHSGQRS